MFKKFDRISILLNFDNWFQLIVQRIFFPSCGPVIYRTGPLEVLIDHQCGDQDGTRSCLYPGLYDPCFEALSSLPKKIRVLDLGANGGGFMLALRKQGYEILTAVAVELNPHTWSRLVLNIYRNIPSARQHLHLLNGAAGAADGSIRIALGRGSVSDTIIGGQQSGEEQFDLPSYSLRTLLDHFPAGERIDLCKVDIEGAEYGLLKGIGSELLARIDNIIIEIHEVEGENPRALVEALENAGLRRVIPSKPLIESNVYLFRR